MATYIKPDAIKDNSLSINKIDNVALDLADKVNALSDEGKNTFLNKIGLGKIGVISQKQNWTSDYSSYTISDVVRGIIPQSFIDLAISIDAFFNDTEETINHTTSWGEVVPNPPGYFYFIGVGDISYKEMVDIYSCNEEGDLPYGAYLSTAGTPHSSFGAKVIRTVKPLRRIMSGADISRFILGGEYVENIILHKHMSGTSPAILYASFQNCYRLKTIIGSGREPFISLNYMSKVESMNYAFSNCYSLKNIWLRMLKYSVSFAQSSRLSNESILYMIQNEAAKSEITITLHADAYARAMADTEILAALETHTNISLASA